MDGASRCMRGACVLGYAARATGRFLKKKKIPSCADSAWSLEGVRPTAVSQLPVCVYRVISADFRQSDCTLLDHIVSGISRGITI